MPDLTSSLGHKPTALGPGPVASHDAPQHRYAAGERAPAPPSAATPAETPAVTLAASVVGIHDGAIIEGVVAGRDAEGHTLIRTEEAALAVVAGRAPAEGERVTLRIVAAAAAIRAEVVLIGGEPQHPPPLLELAVVSVTADPIEREALPLLVPGSIVAGAYLGPSGAPAATETVPLPAPIGTLVALAIDEIVPLRVLPGFIPAGLPVVTNVLASERIVAARVRDAIQQVPDRALLSSDHRIGLALALAPTQRGGPIASPSAPPNAGSGGAAPWQNVKLTATVAGATTDGRALIDSPLGRFVIAIREIPPPGTALAARVSTQVTAPATAPAAHPLVGKTVGGHVVALPAAVKAAAQPVALAPGVAVALTVRTVVLPKAAAETPALTAATAASAGPSPPIAVTRPSPPASTSDSIPVPAPLARPLLFTGLVVGHNSDGHALIETPSGLIAADGLDQIPRGAALVLEASVRRPSTAHVAAEALPFASGGEWATVRDIAVALGGSDKALASQFAANLPAANSKLSAGLLFFLSALQGNARGWVGEPAARTLERIGRRDLLDRLGTDFAAARRLGEERLGVDWRAFLFPFHDGAAFVPIRLYTHQGEDADAEAGQERSLRFVVEIGLSRLGAMQLDGLLRGKRFDLMVRTHAALVAAMQGEIAQVYRHGIAATGYHGDIGFDVRSPFPVRPGEMVSGAAQAPRVPITA